MWPPGLASLLDNYIFVSISFLCALRKAKFDINEARLLVSADVMRNTFCSLRVIVSCPGARIETSLGTSARTSYLLST
jgi:hypothetical protein